MSILTRKPNRDSLVHNSTPFTFYTCEICHLNKILGTPPLGLVTPPLAGEHPPPFGEILDTPLYTLHTTYLLQKLRGFKSI